MFTRRRVRLSPPASVQSFEIAPPSGECDSVSQKGVGSVRTGKRRLDRVARLATLTTVLMTGLSCAPAALAGTNGQQIALDYFSTNDGLGRSVCARLGPPTDVIISGYNQYGRFTTYRSSGLWPDRQYLNDWWWRGAVMVSWRKLGTPHRYYTIAYVPQYDQTPGADWSWEMWKDIVTVDCRGSLRKLPQLDITIHGDGFHEIWACGGWRDGGLNFEELWEGYNEYFFSGGTWTSRGYVGGGLYHYYALGPSDVYGTAHSVPSLVTYLAKWPICD